MLTTIQVKKETLNRLKEHKITARQSYDEVLNTVLNEVEEEELTPEEAAEIRIALEEVKQGKLISIEDLAKEFGIELKNVRHKTHTQNKKVSQKTS